MSSRRAVRSWVSALAMVVVALGAPAVGNGAFGDVDTTFGDLGSAPLVGTSNPFIQPGLVSIVPNADGFALVGSTGDGRRDVLVDVRHGATGSLLSDATRQTAIGVGNAQAGPAVAAPDGGTFVSFSRHTGFGPTVAVARFRPDRSLDPAFGTAGVVTLPGRGGRVGVAGIALGPAGTVVLALTSEDLDEVNRGVLARLLPNGALDPSFGVGGLVATDLGPSNDEPSFVGIAVDAVTGGVTVAASTYVSPNGVATVFRFLSSGGPDTSFSGDGRVDINGLPSIFPRDIAVDSSGRPVVVATRYPGGNRQATVLRVTAAGVLDAGFGVAGMRNVSPPLALTGADADRLVIAAGTGAITIVGSGSGFAVAPSNRLFMARVTGATGAPDGTFGTGGGIADYPGAPLTAAFTMAPIGANVVVAGIATGGGGHGWMGVNAGGTATFSGTQVPLGASTGRDLDILLSRPDGGAIGLTGLFSETTLEMASLTPAGLPDPALGGSGVSTLAVPTASHIIDGRRLPSGAVVVVGYESGGGPADSYVARFRAEGGADPAFGGGDGFVPASAPAGALRFASVVDNPDGSTVVAGFGTTPARAEVRKYLADGSPDLSFGEGDGIATIATPVFNEVHSVGRTSAGGIVVVGESATGAIVARLAPDGALDPAFGTAGIVQIDVQEATGENVNHGVVDSKDRVLLSFSDGQEGMPLVDSPKAWVIRLTPTGAADPLFGTAGLITLPPTRPGLRLRLTNGAMLADDSYVSSAIHTPGSSYSTLLRIDSAGTVTSRPTLLTGTYASPMPDGRLILSGLGNGLNAVRLLGSPPAAPTLTASATSETAIGLEATADAAGFTGVSVVAESGPTAAFGATTPPAALTATQGPQKVNRSLSGLTPGQAYHLRAVVTNASGTAASPPLVVTTPRIAPSARVTLPRRKRAVSASWRTLRGTAVDPAPSSSVARVEVGLYRRAGKRCVALTPRGFRRMTCKLALQTFVRANGAARWTRKVPALVAGKYTLRVRATDGAGIPQAGFVTGQSRVIVKIAAKKKPKKKVLKKKR